MTENIATWIEQEIAHHPVILFMKGTAAQPLCGFSSRVVQILNHLETSYHTVNVLESDSLRQGLKDFSHWPTFPQLYINGEFIGGCDIVTEMFQSGELKNLLP